MLRNSGRVKIGTIILLVLIILVPSAIYGYSTAFAIKPPAPVTLDPKTIPKFINQLVVPPVFDPEVTSAYDNYTITMTQGRQKILPTGTPIVGGVGDGKTSVWGYQGNVTVKGSTLLALGYADGDKIKDFLWSPSATFEARRGVPTNVTWINGITVPTPFAVDPTLNWANPWYYYDSTKAFPTSETMATVGTYPPFPPGYNGLTNVGNPLPGSPPGTAPLNAQTPVPLVPHLHGAEVESNFDGGPDAWWTNGGLRGKYYATSGTSTTAVPNNAAIYYYMNAQEANSLWYHDHALGITRINVMSGLAGFYNLREPASTVPGTTPNTFDRYLNGVFTYGVNEIPLAIQDRTFRTNGEFWYPEVGLNINTHPYWFPEFFGDTIMVNGLVWPNLDVTPGWYRFRLLDGSNARFYTLTLKDQVTGLKVPFIKIGGDGGYLTAAVPMTSITIAPGERADVLVDLSAITPGTTILVENKAKAPFPNGAQPTKSSAGSIMQFTVKATTDPTWTNGVQGATGPITLPASLNPALPGAVWPTIDPLVYPVVKTRFITLNEILGPAGPLMALINGQYYWGDATENATVGTTEDWYIINLTGDTHPIHTHLATFQLVSRQNFDVAGYQAAWLALQKDPQQNGKLVTPPFPGYYTPVPLDPSTPTNFMKGKITLATPEEMGWKDTIQVHPGQVTVLRIRFLQQDGTPYPFNPTAGNGYVYHCHILEHEDNEMMRPLFIEPVV